MLLLSKVTQKHFRQTYHPSKVPLRPAGGYSSRWSVHSCVTCMADLSRYPCPDIFQITTMRCPYKIPFSCRIHFHSEPIHHQATLPYAFKEMTPISFGVANIMLYMVLVVAQLLIERKLKMDMLLEVPFSFIMGYILDLYQIIIPASPESLGLRIVILLAGNICIAFGVYTMVQSHLVLAPVDGVILSISNHYNKAYSLCKNCFDITMIAATIILCLVTRSPLYGICVGRIIKWFEIKQVSLIRS